MRAVVLLGLLAALGCGIPEHGPMMRPGENCLSCHGAGSEPRWYAAGTVYAEAQAAAGDGIQGVEVVITDANNRRISLTSNGAGNFYTAETLVFPASVQVRRDGKTLDMPTQAPEGGCNNCHNGASGGVGRIYAP